MTEGEWVPAKEAITRLRNHCDDPRALLLNLLREGSVTARAVSVKRDGEVVEKAPFLKRKNKELEFRFWEAVSHEDWFAGIFRFVQPAPSEFFGLGESLHWSAVGVECNWVDVIGQLGAIFDNPPSRKKAPANRQLDYDQINRSAIAMRTAQPEISIGSAAASIVADLPPNSKSGKLRDQRHIERIIASLWGEFQQAPL